MHNNAHAVKRQPNPDPRTPLAKVGLQTRVLNFTPSCPNSFTMLHLHMRHLCSKVQTAAPPQWYSPHYPLSTIDDMLMAMGCGVGVLGSTQLSSLRYFSFATLAPHPTYGTPPSSPVDDLPSRLATPVY